MQASQRTGIGDGKSLAQDDPMTELERDELLARLVDAYLDEHEAEIGLRAAAQMQPRGRATPRLLAAARAYGEVCKRIAFIREGVSVEVLYGQIVVGHALAMAEVIRRQRREREEALAEVET